MTSRKTILASICSAVWLAGFSGALSASALLRSESACNELGTAGGSPLAMTCPPSPCNHAQCDSKTVDDGWGGRVTWCSCLGLSDPETSADCFICIFTGESSYAGCTLGSDCYPKDCTKVGNKCFCK